jgi:hypothetical protein
LWPIPDGVIPVCAYQCGEVRAGKLIFSGQFCDWSQTAGI